jgi:pimeloyl-ACP methyl ester carboxylesterase
VGSESAGTYAARPRRERAACSRGLRLRLSLSREWSSGLTHVHHLLLYEPSLGLRYPPRSIEAVEQALAAGDREAAIRLVFVGIMEMSEQEVEEMRASPLWPVRLASAPTVPRECRVEEDWAYRPGQFSRLTAPTLVLTGSETPPAVREATGRAAAAISNAEIQVLEGHGHFAFQADPAMVAAVIRQFVAS